MSLVALAETLAWLIIGSYRFAVQPETIWEDLQPFIVAASWLYATCRPIASPSATPPYDLFALYCLRLAFDVLNFGGILYDHTVYDDPLPGTGAIVGHVLNLVALTVLLVIIFSMPLAVPGPAVKSEDIVRTHTTYICVTLITLRRERPCVPRITPRSGAGRPSTGSSHSSTRALLPRSMKMTFGI